MPSYINTNVASLNAQRNLSSSQGALATSLQRLSSGLRINSARDDAAGLAISQAMTSQIRGLNVGARNAADGVSLAQTAEGALASIGNNLQRMRELAVQAANFPNTASIPSIDAEYQLLAGENARVVAQTKFNGTALLTGVSAASFQVGANAGETISITSASVAFSSATTLGSTNATASSQITLLDTDISAIAAQRATYGSVQSQFEAVISAQQNTAENLSAARSRITDTDYAAETAQLTRNQILQQAGTAMLAQANQLPNTVLTLLK